MDLIELCRISSSYKEILKYIENGADVNFIDEYGYTPLFYQCMYCNTVDVIELLISHNANVNFKTQLGTSPLNYACVYEAPNEVIECLIHNNANITDVISHKNYKGLNNNIKELLNSYQFQNVKSAISE